MAKRKFYPLYDLADEEKVRPILDKIKDDGYERTEEEEPSARDVVFFFMSKNLKEGSSIFGDLIKYADRSKIVPVNLDGAPLLSSIQGSIKASNAVFAERYTTEELAKRLEETLRPGSDIPKWLRYTIIAVSAVILLSVTGVIISRALAKGNDVRIVSSVDKPQETVIPEEIPTEDVEKIVELIFIGDTYRWYTEEDGSYKENGYWKGYSEFAYRYWTDAGARWLSKEDGHEFPKTHYDDLSWITKFPNLRAITFCAVDAEVPSLSELKRLNHVAYCDCNIGSLEWLRNTKIKDIEYHGNDVVDFSPLTLCTDLTEAHLDIVYSTEADFSDFHPYFLRRLYLGNGGTLREPVDISALGQCKMLLDLQMENIPITGKLSLSQCKNLLNINISGVPFDSLSFMSLCYSLEALRLSDMNLRTLDGIQKMSKLKEIYLDNVNGLTDISALENCKELRYVEIRDNEGLRITDYSVLGELPELDHLTIDAPSTLPNLDFMEGIKQNKSLVFICNSSVSDFSGLSAISGFNRLEISSDNYNEEVIPYINEATIGLLVLNNCRNVDLSLLPRVSSRILIRDCDFRSLEGIDQQINTITLENCNELRSLNGIEGLERFGDGNGTISIIGCPRLNDFSALEGMYLNTMEFERTYSLPDFSKTSAKTIIFNHVDETVLPDLSCLKSLDTSNSYILDFSGQENITDITPIYKLHGSKLKVPPTVQLQAKELVESGNFEEFEVEYPQNDWRVDDSPIVLESFEDLDTLPKSALARVEALGILGDVVYDPREYHVEWEYEDDILKAYLCKNENESDDGTEGSDESDDGRVWIEEPGTVITDISVFKDLTGLRELKLASLPIENLEGVQYLENLEILEVNCCEGLTDASAAFTLQQLKYLNLNDTGITSVKGINYLYNLEEVDLYGVGLEDETELEELPKYVRVNR